MFEFMFGVIVGLVATVFVLLTLAGRNTKTVLDQNKKALEFQYVLEGLMRERNKLDERKVIELAQIADVLTAFVNKYRDAKTKVKGKK